MHFTVLRMIASGSLSAFSASALDGVSLAGGIAQKAQAMAAEVPPSNASTPRQPAKAGTPGQMPSKNLPRGSLLNLCV
jgi:hypothetical protein